MKKTVAKLLACSMLLATPNLSQVTYGMDTSTDEITKVLESMQQVGLMEKGETLAKNPVEVKELISVLEYMNLDQTQIYQSVLQDLEGVEEVTQQVFYNVFLQFLGYEKDIDFKQEQSVQFAKNLGLYITEDSFGEKEFVVALDKILKTKMKFGRDFFEFLLSQGFMSDYNEGKETPEILVFDGKTQPIFNYEEIIYEKVYVEAPLDTDADGKLDLLEVWIKRPAETAKGMQVPVVFEYSPYERGTNDDLYYTYGVDEDLVVSEGTDTTLEDIKYIPQEKELPEAREVKGEAEHGTLEKFDFDGWYDYFLPRGYAVVSAGGPGTRGSDGMVNTGSQDEVMAAVAIINWLNGDAKAYTNKTDNIEVKADWSTGSVGMMGRSYRGTVPVGVAATGVEGLETIVPVAAISSWYDYYRTNGLNLAGEGWQGDDIDILSLYCMSRMFDSEDYATVEEKFESFLEEMYILQDRTTGDYNTFWDERNYLNNADQIEASVFIVHGLSDWNVKSKQFDMLWKELERYDVPRQMVLHQGEHISIDNLAGIDFNNQINRWFDYWLYDIENNVMEDFAPVTIQNNTTLEFEEFDNWGQEEETITLHLGKDEVGVLTTEASEKEIIETFTDDLSLSGYDRENPQPLQWRNAIVLNPEIQREDRLAYTTAPLAEELRINGTIDVTLKAALDQPTGILSVMLVDYGQAVRPTIATEVVQEDAIHYGGNAGTADLVDLVMEEAPSEYKIISRGWMDAQNREANYKVSPIEEGEYYTFKIDMQPMDYVVREGHQLGLIIYSTDAEYSMRPLKITDFKVDISESYVEIPVVK